MCSRYLVKAPNTPMGSLTEISQLVNEASSVFNNHDEVRNSKGIYGNPKNDGSKSECCKHKQRGHRQSNVLGNHLALTGPVRTWEKRLPSLPERDEVIPQHGGQGRRSRQ